ncbi:hypothetical protein BH24DEI2_BH24DEI2_14670 [soil metagenome]
MPRPVTLFTGQWADLPLTELAPLAKEMGYDGLELACWGDHFLRFRNRAAQEFFRHVPTTGVVKGADRHRSWQPG